MGGPVEVVDDVRPAEERLHVRRIPTVAHHVLGIIERFDRLGAGQNGRATPEETRTKHAAVASAPLLDESERILDERQRFTQTGKPGASRWLRRRHSTGPESGRRLMISCASAFGSASLPSVTAIFGNRSPRVSITKQSASPVRSQKMIPAGLAKMPAVLR